MKKFKSLLVVILAIGLTMMTFVGCQNNNKQPAQSVVGLVNSTYKMKIEKNSDFEDIMGTVEIVQGKIGSNRFEAGEEVTVLAKANEGFAIQSAYLDDNPITSALRKGKGKYTFRATRDRVIKVNFVSEDELEFSYFLDLSGFKSYQADVKVTPQKDGYNDGDEITFSITEKKACKLRSFSINGEDLTNKLVNNTYSLVVDGDLDVEIKFDEDKKVIKHATVDTFDEEIDMDGKVLVDFYAPWCNPCVNILGPILDKQLAPEGKVKIVKVEIQDIDYNPYPEQAIFSRYAAKYNNEKGNIPFVVLFENGKDVKGYIGAFSEYSELVRWLGI